VIRMSNCRPPPAARRWPPAISELGAASLRRPAALCSPAEPATGDRRRATGDGRQAANRAPGPTNRVNGAGLAASLLLLTNHNNALGAPIQ